MTFQIKRILGKEDWIDMENVWEEEKKGCKGQKEKGSSRKGKRGNQKPKKTRKNIVEEMRFEDMDETKKQFRQKNIPHL